MNAKSKINEENDLPQNLTEALREMYVQANEHLRETDKKRDQLVTFYLLIIGFMFSSLSSNSVSLCFLCLLVGIIGIIFSMILISYRKWHKIYVNSATVIQHFMITQEYPTLGAAEDKWRELFKKKDKRKDFISLAKSTEYLIFFSFLVISVAPFYILVNTYSLAIIHFVYVIIMSYFFHKSGIFTKLPSDNWLFKSLPVRKIEPNDESV